MLLDYEKIKELELQYGSSFYLLDVNKLRENYSKIETAFKSRYPNFLIGYSYKTNYLPYLCKEIYNLGGYAEVVSRLEYDLAIKIGVDPRKIIFNGPVKNLYDIKTALLNESILNIDSFYELEYVEKVCLQHENKKFKIGIRVNFDISENGVSPHQEGYQVSRFGICVENGDLFIAINKINSIPNLQIVGLHGHFSTKNRSTKSFQKITKGLCNIAKSYLLDTVEYIDIGGGIYGEVPKSFQIETPSFDDYAETICNIMNDEFSTFEQKPILVLEPGISMVANTIFFIAKVIDVKEVGTSNFVLVDGSVHNIKPTMHKRNLPLHVVKSNDFSRDSKMFHIVGYTCMEKDYLAYELLEEFPQRDDYIIFENVGAYTIVFNPPFIKERPGIIAQDGEITFVVRRKETIKEFFDENLYCFNVCDHVDLKEREKI